MENEWYVIENISELDSPALVIYPDRVVSNIQKLVNSVDDIALLRPHIKTHKSFDVSKLMLAAGITKFKCATIAEAEMLASAGAPDILLAYQPVGPKANRLLSMIQQFPSTRFACLVDDVSAARAISSVFEAANASVEAFIDLNVGMNRTGVEPENAMALYDACRGLKGLQIVGLHAYDGHIRDTDLNIRSRKCDEAFERVTQLQGRIKDKYKTLLSIVAGGTPTFSVHRKRKEAECSPGTFIYWDKGYSDMLKEQDFNYAALVITRVISKPSEDTICVDLGHKAIASENPITSRVSFLNAPNLIPTGHSEEHMVFKVSSGRQYNVGDVLYGVPFHICPTVALYDRAALVRANRFVDYWSTSSRTRKITI